MEQIKAYVEEIIKLCGISGPAVPIVRHILLAAVAVVLAWASYTICRRILTPVLHRITRRTPSSWDDILLGDNVLKAACQIMPAIVVSRLLPLVFFQYPTAREIMARLTAVYITVMAARLFNIFIGATTHIETKSGAAAKQYYRTFCGVVKIVAVCIAAIISVSILIDKSPATLLAGLGATSAVLMLVFKDTIEGLVAGIRLTSAGMLHVGDWITVDSARADGTVEEISLTTVKVRNFDNTVTTVPPITLVNGSFQNWAGMERSAGRRVSRKVYYDFRSVGLSTPKLEEALAAKGLLAKEDAGKGGTNIALYRKYMERWIAARADVNATLTLLVRQREATQSGLPLEFYFFIANKEFVRYEASLAEIMEWAYAVAPEFGLKIYQQYPEQ